ncbi:hypothetical protein MC885_009373 [Smutsia gigantea]|nr:hypothetical protein MC885_009373 [Smutsia gigantea]
MALCDAVTRGSSLPWPRVFLFGDSITQGSPFFLATLKKAKLTRAYYKLNTATEQMIKNGMPPFVQQTDLRGYNTRWAKIILPRLIRKGNSLDTPVAVTIFFGANDSALKDENPKQHIPLDEYSGNLKNMVQYLKSVGVPEHRIILITPPPLCEAAWEKECLTLGCKLDRLNSVVGEYASACLQVAQDCGTDTLDLWTLMQKDRQDISSYLSDGLHLSPEGNEFLFSHLWPLIEKKASSLPLLLPYWRDIAEAEPELSLLGDGHHWSEKTKSGC